MSKTIPLLLALLVTLGIFVFHQLGAPDNSYRQGFSESDNGYAYPATRRVTDYDFSTINAVNRDSFYLSASRPSVQVSDSAIPSPAELRTSLIPGLRWLRTQPIVSYSDSLRIESTRCPTTHLQSNQGQLEGNGEWWKSVKSEVLETARGQVVEAVADVFGFNLQSGEAGFDTDETMKTSLGSAEWDALFGDGGRGVVYTAGNKDTSARLLTSIKILRRHGCILPIEVWGFRHEVAQLGSLRTDIESQGNVTFRELNNTRAQEGAWKQFQVKGEAIARSSFSEVLYMDSDNIAVRDPTFLFNSPLYKENGIVLWPDFNKDSAANPIWRTLGKACEPQDWQVETGQILVSKLARGGMNLAALFAAEAMNANHEFWFRLSGGDKDTFRYAFYFLSLPYSAAPHWLSAAGSVIPTHDGHRFCGHTMLQYGLSGAEWTAVEDKLDSDYSPPAHAPPLFVHANLLKHSGYNNRRGSTFSAIKYAVPDLTRSIISRLLLNDIRGAVYNHRGMCSDLWDSAEDVGEGSGDQVDGAFEQGRVAVIPWTAAWGGLLKNFEDMYYDEGGQAGAW